MCDLPIRSITVLPDIGLGTSAFVRQEEKKGSESQALGAAETGSTKESEEASFGDDEDGLLSSKGSFLNDKIVDFQQQHPETFKEITAMLDDEASTTVMISSYESYGDKDEFDELPSLNVGVLRASRAQ